MKKKRRELTMRMEQERGELTLQGQCVLRWELSWPEWGEKGAGARRLTAFYRRRTQLLRSRWGRELYTLACLDFAARSSEGRAFRPWRAALTTCISYQDDSLISLWQEAEEQWGMEPAVRHRMGDTWSLPDGMPRTLGSFFQNRKGWKKELLNKVRHQAEEQYRSGMSLLDPDCGVRMKREFDRQNFYVTGQGLALFFPMYALGAGAEGIPVFQVSTA